MNSWVRIDRLIASNGILKLFQWLFICVLTTLIVVQQALMFRMPIHNDEAVFLRVGRDLANGRKLYVDTWDHKPPAIYLLAALILDISQRAFGTEIVWARMVILVVNMISFVLIMLLFMGEHNLGQVMVSLWKRLSATTVQLNRSLDFARDDRLNYPNGSARETAVALLVGLLFLWLNLYWQGGYFLAEPMVICVFFGVWYWMNREKVTGWEWLIIGIMVGGMFWLKQMAIPLMIVIGLQAWRQCSFGKFILFIAGGFASLAGLWIWLWQMSDVRAGMDAIVWFNLLNYPPETLNSTLKQLPSIMAPAVVLLIFGLFWVVRYRMKHIGMGLALMLPILLSRPYHHYWILLLPLLILSIVDSLSYFEE